MAGDEASAIFRLVNEFLNAEVPVAAICGATIALANAGILNNYRYTSNDLNFLKQTCPNYQGAAQYVQQPVVTDRNLITATGIAPLEFAKQVFEKLQIFEPGTLEAWYNLFRAKEPRYFSELMQSLSRAAS